MAQFVRTHYKGEKTKRWTVGICQFDCFEVSHDGMTSYLFAPQYHRHDSLFYQETYDQIAPCIPREEYIKTLLLNHKSALVMRAKGYR